MNKTKQTIYDFIKKHPKCPVSGVQNGVKTIARQTIANNMGYMRGEGLLEVNEGLYTIIDRPVGKDLEAKLAGVVELKDAKEHAYNLSVLLQRFEKYNVEEPEIIATLKALIEHHGA